MAFAIVGYFDKKSHEKIKSLWGDMAKIGVIEFHPAKQLFSYELI